MPTYAIPAGFPVGTKDVEMKCEAVGDPAVWTLAQAGEGLLAHTTR